MLDEYKHCPYCGAPIKGEVCTYCKAEFYKKEEQAFENNAVEENKPLEEKKYDYPVMDCKEANNGILTVGLPLIFGISFCLAGLLMFPQFHLFLFPDSSKDEVMLSLTPFIIGAVIFLAIGVGAIFFAFIPIRRKRMIEANGELVTGTVIGYENDPNITINDYPAQILLIQAKTREGTKILRYQLASLDKPYEIDSKIDIKIYNEYVMIMK